MKTVHPVMELADALEVSASGYAEHQLKAEGKRRREDELLGRRLCEIFEANRRVYGAPRLQAQLRAEGRRVGKNRIGRLQRSLGLRPKGKRRFRPRTTQCAITGLTSYAWPTQGRRRGLQPRPRHRDRSKPGSSPADCRPIADRPIGCPLRCRVTGAAGNQVATVQCLYGQRIAQ